MGQLLALIKKEFLAIWSDKKSRMVIIIPPMLQLILFSHAVTLEITNVSIGILDRDNSAKSTELVRALKDSPTFTRVYRLDSEKELAVLLDTQKILAAVYIPAHFAGKIDAGQAVSLQIIADGRKSSTAQIVQSYLQNIVALRFEGKAGQIVIARNWYNPNLDHFWWILPNLMGSLSMLVALILTSLSIARERELGTFEQLLVSPLPLRTLMFGKIIPPLLISIIEGSVIFFAATVLFGIPFEGSFVILYLGLVTFLFSIVGFGLFISSLVSTQQQGILGAFVLMVPYILMSGFATPVENMPQWLIPLTDLVSLKYFLVLLKGVFLKDISFGIALKLIMPMFILGMASLLFASLMFRKKVG